MAVVESKSLILSNEWVNDEYKHMTLDVGPVASKVEPGQFFNLLCPQTKIDKPFFRRPMSTYYSNEDTNRVEFLYKVTGAGTRALATLQEGDTLQILGPLGKGFTVKQHYRHIMVVGRGVGLATLAPLAERAAEMNIHVTALLSAKDRKRLMSQYRFENINATLLEVTDNDQSSSMQNVEALIHKIHGEQPIDAIYTCGSTRITRLLQQLAISFNIDGEVALEQHMACGIGMCYCCVRPMKVGKTEEIKSKRVCHDGPVFNIKEVVL
ncbi:MAG: dihydroorotate dehydrogenase electron transfer subunit [Haemophilus parainfluenzae]